MDIRLPIGLMFSMIGVLLTLYGVVVSDPKVYQRSLGINLNFWWGLVLLAFGLTMLVLTRRAARLATTSESAAPPNPGHRRH